jgi:hypothetical protein
MANFRGVQYKGPVVKRKLSLRFGGPAREERAQKIRSQLAAELGWS